MDPRGRLWMDTKVYIKVQMEESLGERKNEFLARMYIFLL
jgi:hypothetical protein